MPKRRRTAEQTHSADWLAKRRQIRQVAAEVFAEMGFERGTTREIAARIGLTQPALYHYVGSKEDLLTQISIEVADEFTKRVEEALDLNQDPLQRIKSLIHAFVKTMSEYQLGFGLRFSELQSLPKPVFKKLKAQEREFVSMITAAVAEAQQAGALAPQRSSRVVALSLIGMLSWTFAWFDPKRDNADEVSAAFCDLLGLPRD